MRVLVCEFVTGGGLVGADLPPSLAREGALMRDALLRDLSELSGVELATTHDARLDAPACDSRAILAGEDPWAVWAELARGVDVAWAVAPETGGSLLKMTQLLRAGGAHVVGPGDEAIRIASSKLLTAERLIAAGVPAAPAWRADAIPSGVRGPFVTKPDDGAGCDATLLVEAPDHAGVVQIVQPYVPGEAASLTVLRRDGETRLLAANRQLIAIEDGAFRFRGIVVGALDDRDGRLADLACAVTKALPGLDGIFGIDIVLGVDGPVVIEVNPRLTTAYAGLREALGVNPASLVAPFAERTDRLPAPGRAVEIAL